VRGDLDGREPEDVFVGRDWVLVGEAVRVDEVVDSEEELGAVCESIDLRRVVIACGREAEAARLRPSPKSDGDELASARREWTGEDGDR